MSIATVDPAPPPHAARRFGTGIALALGGSTLFSAKAVVIKLAYRYGVDAVTLITLRMVLALPLFAIALAWSARRAPPLALRDHLRLAALGLVGYYAASFLDFLGLRYVSAGLERLILYLSPSLVLLFSAVLLRRPVRRVELAALAVSYAGIAVVAWHDVSLHGADLPRGAALVFGSAVCYALYLLLSGEIVQRVGAIRLTSYAMCVSTAACVAQFLATEPLAALHLPLAVYRLSLVNALACTVLPVFAVMLAVERIGSPRTSIASMIGPVATIALAWALLDEPVSTAQLAGTALVIAGIALMSAYDRRRPPAAPGPSRGTLRDSGSM